MGKAEEWCRMDRAVVCEESLIWFEGMPVVVGDELMTTGFFWCNVYNGNDYNDELISKMHKEYIDKVPLRV